MDPRMRGVRRTITTASVLFGLVLAFPAIADGPAFLRTWGSYGTGPGEFNLPAGIAVDSQGNVFVADTGNNRIQKFSSDGTFLLSWGSMGSGDGQFEGPVALAVGPNGTVYVAENGSNSSVNQHRIQAFTGSGSFITKWGSLGHDLVQFNSPYGITVDDGGNVYVADTGNDRIQVFSPSGEFLTAWGTHGAAEGQFTDPWGIARGIAGDLYISERGLAGSRVQHFMTDRGVLGSWGLGGFGYARGIAVAADGTVYVVDQLYSRVQAFNAGGSLLFQWGTNGASPGQFANPIGIAVDGGGRIYVADSSNHRVQVFGDLPTPVERSSWGAIKASYR